MNARPRILVVDDNPVNLRLAGDVLSSDGYDVLRAPGGREALDLLKTTAVDLILMDIEMPHLNGLTLTRMLKADPATAGITVIALTASAMPGDEGKALEAGCDGYIIKPIDTRTLGATVARYLRPEPRREEP